MQPCRSMRMLVSHTFVDSRGEWPPTSSGLLPSLLQPAHVTGLVLYEESESYNGVAEKHQDKVSWTRERICQGSDGKEAGRGACSCCLPGDASSGGAPEGISPTGGPF